MSAAVILTKSQFEQKLLELRDLKSERQLEIRRSKIDSFYPDAGPLRRDLYAKHLEFFRAGSQHRERLFLAANRVGKSEGVGAYECALHLTGEYPEWWEGRRFSKPITSWAAGDTSKTTRDIIQNKLLGPVNALGTGMVRGSRLIRTTAKPGVPDAIESAYVRHITGGVSEIGFKSYDQGRISFQGTERDVIWLDEECDRGIYVESLMRTMTTNGLLMLTFTPLQGTTEIVREFLHLEMPVTT